MIGWVVVLVVAGVLMLGAGAFLGVGLFGTGGAMAGVMGGFAASLVIVAAAWKALT